MTASPLRLDRKRICLHIQGAKCAAVNEISGFRHHVVDNFALPGSTPQWMVVRVVHQLIRTAYRSHVQGSSRIRQNVPKRRYIKTNVQ
jgi:hypothetical protein